MSKEKTIRLGHIAEKALDLLKAHPDGLSMAQMRDMLNATAETQ